MADQPDKEPTSPAGNTDTCATILLDALRTRPGVRSVTVHPESGELRICYNPEQISLERIEALADELGGALAEIKESCIVRSGGASCEDCPEFVRKLDSGLPGARWLDAAGRDQRLGIERGGGGGMLQEFTLGSRPRDRRVFFQFTREGILEFLPVVLCGLLLISGWVLEQTGVYTAPWVFIASCIAGGLPTLWSTVNSLLARKLDVDLLMLMGAGGAAILEYWDESATLLFLFTLSSALESFAMGRTRRALESLVALRPDEATILRGGEPLRVSVQDVARGEHLLVRPGERLPLDGTVVEGQADVDESALTGEAVPVSKGTGSELLAGSINLNGSLVVEVSRQASESTLSRIVQLVEEAREARAPTERIFDRFAKYYIVLILLAATTTAVLPPLLGRGSWSEMFYRAMILLVVASPCALVISTPATILSAIAAAARRGILFKGGAAVEALGQASAVAFDKTGTLTDGIVAVTEIEGLGGHSEEDVLRLAATAEGSSEHVLAQAIVEAAEARQLEIPRAGLFRAHPGLGVEAEHDGQRILVGNRRFLQGEGVDVPDPATPANGRIGKAIWVARGKDVIGRVRFADTLRPEAPAVVERLRGLGIGRITMLTGDDERTARGVAASSGIDDLHAGLLPAEKVRELKRLGDQGERMVMVGDGINDAPAMAASSVGVAMGAAGTDVACEAADVVLMASNLDKLVEALALGRRARRLLYQNLTFASAVIVVLVSLALTAVLKLPHGVAAHEGSTLLVVLNGLRLLGWRPGEVGEAESGSAAAITAP